MIPTKSLLVPLLLAAAALAPAAVLAQSTPPAGRMNGIGVIVGDPTGFSFEHWLDGRAGIDFALGSDGSHLQTHADYLLHIPATLPQNGPRLPFYIGLGGMLTDRDDTMLGVRFVGGLNYFATSQPVEFFGELVPILRIAPSIGSNIDFGIGLRYYFGRK